MKQCLPIIAILLIVTACSSPVQPDTLDKAQLRNTLREGYFQFIVDLWMEVSKEVHIRAAALDVYVNGVYLGQAILAADTRPLEPGRHKLGLRVVFPNTKLVLTTPNIVEIKGTIQLSSSVVRVQVKDEQMSVLNLTGM
jgi:hypothetical protein